MSRFELDGFVPTGEEGTSDTSTHQVEEGRIGDCSVTLIRPRELADVVGFAVASVDSGTLSWEFRNENFQGIARLAIACGKTVVAFCTRGRDSKVVRVTPLAELGLHQFEHRAGLVAGDDIGERLAMKIAAAAFLGIDFELTETEKLVERVKRRRAREETEAKRAAEADRREARAKERGERRERILRRGRVSGFTMDGQRRHGYPVVGDEWKMLEDGTFVIAVESYDDETGNHGVIVESFCVGKSAGGKLSRHNIAPVSPDREDSAKEAETLPRPQDHVLIEVNGEFLGVSVFLTMDDVRKIYKSSKVNSGTLVAATDRTAPDGRLEVLVLAGGEMRTKGHFAPLS